ncbi:MAG: helix-turn-helix transcriptional regulator [Ardenticatenaceae bacterium]|nr:helix-turn-helix transcriptional regulator [Anaerolineales bacterium]MCB9009411.1 helix-turn-helix transcriptional regulator [Ardenticatenaceae bacterium]
MFGNKNKKQDRLFSIGRLVHRAEEGISQAELARQLGVSRSTLTKDMGIVERETGVRFWEDDNGRLHWSEYND